MTYPSPPPAHADPYRRGAIMLAILSLMGLGGSNVLGALMTSGRVPIEWLALASVPILLGTAWGTTRRSRLAYRIGMGTWLVVALISLLQAVLRSTSGSILVVSFFFIVIMARFLSDTDKAMRIPTNRAADDPGAREP